MGWERWLFDSTFLLWTDYDDCCLLAVFVFVFQGRLEHKTITFRICFVAWLPPCFSGVLLCFGVPARSCFCLNGVSVRVCVGFSVLGVSPPGWGGVCLAFPPFLPPSPPPPCCLLRLASTLAARCLRKLGGPARNGPDPPQPSV